MSCVYVVYTVCAMVKLLTASYSLKQDRCPVYRGMTVILTTLTARRATGVLSLNTTRHRF